MDRWRTERVTALAPDSASDVAGRRLANPAPWSDVGWEPPLVWGSCQGSGKTPYRVAVDVSAPSYTCTCPSRKFPCKHVLGLLYLWAEGRIDPGGGIASFAAEWAAKRAATSTATDAPTGADEPRSQTPEQREAAEKRSAQRDERVRTGMVELDRWLADQVTVGMATTAVGGYPGAVAMAARMVDAQAPAVATRLRDLAAVAVSGRDWPERLMSDLGLIHLLATATARLDDLDDVERQTVRKHLGYPVARDDVLATPPVTDRWVVVGMRDSDEEQVSMRRVWLRGVDTGRAALVLFFTPYGMQVDTSLLPGMMAGGDLHFYPGRPQLRATFGRRDADGAVADWHPQPWTVAEAAEGWAAAVAEDPWLPELPALICGSPVAPRSPVSASPTAGEVRSGSWLLVDAAGDAVPLVGSDHDRWQLLALTGGAAHPVFGELSGAGFRPTSFVTAGRLVTL